ncbi:MAG TPA: AMP-binding protein, partial [Chloroflexota bacterium]|nr:AMP-binding protein [Chloroflexota bacterium]
DGQAGDRTVDQVDWVDREDQVAWRPGPAQWERSQLARLLERLRFVTLNDFRKHADAEPAWFWGTMIQELGIEWSRPPQQTLDLSQGKPWAKWFVGAGFNYTASALDRWVRDGSGDAPALAWEGENGRTGALTYRQLLEEVGRAANALKSLGVGKGDRVGIYLPLTLECAVATLACGRIGAIFTPIFSGYGAGAVATRLNDSEACLLITADGFYRRGQLVAMKQTAYEAVASAPSVERVLVVRRTASSPSEGGVQTNNQQGGQRNGVPWQEGRDVWWHVLVPEQSADCPPEGTNANDPYMIIYTSGTTGQPKGAQHVHAGFPLKAASDQMLCLDVQPGDRVFWYSDIGWMMAPWLIQGALLRGATAFLYDGAPDWPEPDRVWDLVERHQITVLGIAPTAIRALMRLDVDYVRRHNRSTLRALASSGEPWNPDAWWWYFREVGEERCPIINYSGGTEISGGIVGCTTIEPQRPCSFTGPVPGMAADVVDAEGNRVRGEVGELVVHQPWVGMTQGFWRGPSGSDPQRAAAADERYLNTYWSTLPDIWVHGDWALVDEAGFWYIQGRSDDTIKVAGKRVGPAEVESAAMTHPALAEAAAVGVPHDLKGEEVALFCVLKPSATPNGGNDLEGEIARAVVEVLGKTLRPGRVLFVRELPKTRNAKVMRRLVRALCLGREDLGDLSGLENPKAIDALREALGR